MSLKNQFHPFLKDLQRLVKVGLYHAPIIVRPEQIEIDITDRCNYRCPICEKWLTSSSAAADELNTVQWKVFLKDAVGLALTKKVVFAGGEPLLRSDLPELIACSSGLGYTTVVISNASLLDENALKTLQQAGLDYLMVSLNGLDADLHDRSRGVNGSFMQIMEVINTYQAIRASMRLGIATVIMEDNAEQLLPLAEYVSDQHLHGIIYQACMDRDIHHPFRKDRQSRLNRSQQETHPAIIRNHQLLDAVISKLLTFQRQRGLILNPPSQLRAMRQYFRDPMHFKNITCTAGMTSFMVDAYGDVRCCFGMNTIGNISQTDPHLIWKSDQATELRKMVSVCERSCRLMNNIY